MSKKNIAILAGDGIGPEIMAEAQKVLNAVEKRFGYKFEYSEALIGGIAIDTLGSAFPDETRKACESADAVLFGAVGGPKWETLPPKEQPERAALLPIRKAFRLFANLRPSIIYPPLAAQSPLKPAIVGNGFDILIVRELTGGIYFGQPRTTETLPDGGERATDSMVYTTSEIERIGRIAFEAARKRTRNLCSVDKANVLDNGVLWRKTMQTIAKDYPDVTLTHLYVDNAAMQLVKNPQQFDVIVTGNMFGDILSDLASVLPGSLGMIPSASLGADGNFGLYEPAGGSAPDIAGQGIANPIAQILSAAMLLRYSFSYEDAAHSIENAVVTTLADGYRTGDIMGEGCRQVSTEEMGNAIAERI